MPPMIYGRGWPARTRAWRAVLAGAFLAGAFSVAAALPVAAAVPDRQVQHGPITVPIAPATGRVAPAAQRRAAAPAPVAAPAQAAGSPAGLPATGAEADAAGPTSGQGVVLAATGTPLLPLLAGILLLAPGLILFRRPPVPA